MAGSAYKLRVEGLRELQGKLRGHDLFAAPYREALEESAQAAEDAIRSRAPVDTGRLKARLTHRLQASPVPRYAVIKTTATRSSAKYRRYSYPKRLEFDPKSRHRDWMLRGLMSVRGRVQSALSGAARKIESRFGR